MESDVHSRQRALNKIPGWAGVMSKEIEKKDEHQVKEKVHVTNLAASPGIGSQVVLKITLSWTRV